MACNLDFPKLSYRYSFRSPDDWSTACFFVRQTGAVPRCSMQADARGHPLARFEDFLLDIRTGELCKQGGQSIRLPEQSFQILTMLLDHPGEVVGREEIRKR